MDDTTGEVEAYPTTTVLPRSNTIGQSIKQRDNTHPQTGQFELICLCFRYNVSKST